MTIRRAAPALPASLRVWPWPLPALLALLLLLLQGGCAVFGGDGNGNGKDGTGARPLAADAPRTPAGPPAVRVDIEAPGALKTLLERNLDVIRLGALAGADIDDTEWARLIDAAPAQARELLQTEGYFDAQVSLDRSAGGAPLRPGAATTPAVQAAPAAFAPPDVVAPPRVPAVVLLRVLPGVRAVIGTVTIEAEGELARAAAAGERYAVDTLARLRGNFTLASGKAFRNPDWNAAKAGALARLRADGYATALWSGTSATVDVPNNRVDLFMVADSGPLFRYGSMQVDGLVVHEAETVEHLAGFAAGVPVTESLLLDFQERLQKSSLFEAVSVTLEPEPARAGLALVQVRLREAPLQVYTAGLGITGNNGVRASLEQLHRRPFGRALIARNKLEVGQLRQSLAGELSTHPGPRFYRNLVGYAMENLETSEDRVQSLRVRVGRAQDMARIERLYFVEAERSVREAPGISTRTTALSLQYHGIWRRLDNALLPTNGYAFTGETAVGRSQGDDSPAGPFTRAFGRLTLYRPLGDSWFGQARLEAGKVFTGSGVRIPESLLFRAGGDDSVRGYRYRSLGPLVDGAVGSGKVLLTTSLEVARPILERLPALWGAVFVDAGSAADSFQALEPAVGFGAGVRYRSPVGPLRLDIAWGQEARRLRLHFSVGVTF